MLLDFGGLIGYAQSMLGVRGRIPINQEVPDGISYRRVRGDFDLFKQRFDSDPLGRKQIAKGYTMLRGVDNPSEIFLRLEFDSVEDARSLQEKVRGSDVTRGMTIKVPPTVTEMVDQATY